MKKAGLFLLGMAVAILAPAVWDATKEKRRQLAYRLGR
jgi:hypothetical protein